MKIDNGNRDTELGPGVHINLDDCEVATAIDAYLVAHNVHISGARTITVNGSLWNKANVCVDPSGFVIYKGIKFTAV